VLAEWHNLVGKLTRILFRAPSPRRSEQKQTARENPAPFDNR
jgi:hypothetical protein